MSINSNRYWLGPMTNYARLTRTPFATYQSAEAMRERMVATSNVAYDAVTKCMVLRPLPTIQPMQLSDWIVSGAWSICQPAAGSWQADYLHAHSAVGNAITSASSRATLPDAPGFAIDFVRADGPPTDQTDPQRWQINFGKFFTLEFGGRDDVVLTRAGGRTMTRVIEPGERREMWKDPQLRWEIQQIGHDLRIACSGLREEWMIPDVMASFTGTALGDRDFSPWIPRGRVTVNGAGGGYAFSLQRYQYATSGVATSPWIETYQPRVSNEAVLDVFTLPDAWGSATISIAANSGTRVKLQIAFTGDGDHTPAVGAWQAYWLPDYDVPTDEWTEVTDAIEQASLSMSLDGAATCEMTLNDQEGAASDLLALVAAPGQMAMRAAVGYDGTAIETLTGIVHEIAVSDDADGARAISLRASDRKKQLSDAQLIFAPCLIGLYATEAVALLARWAGLDAVDTSDVQFTATLDDPGRNYQSPPWLPAMGSTARDMIDRICQTYGLRLDAFGADGLRLVQDTASDPVIADYSAELGASDADTLTAHEMVTDFTDARNAVMVVGRSYDGRPLFYNCVDADGVLKMGYLATVVDQNEELCTQAAVAYACRQAFEKLGRPRRRVRLSSDCGTLHDRLPGEIITITSTTLGLDALPCRVLGVTINDAAGRDLLSVDLDAEEVL